LQETKEEAVKGDLPAKEVERRTKREKDKSQRKAILLKDIKSMNKVNKRESFGPRSREQRNRKKALKRVRSAFGVDSLN